jgi:hypothetical protein
MINCLLPKYVSCHVLLPPKFKTPFPTSVGYLLSQLWVTIIAFVISPEEKQGIIKIRVVLFVASVKLVKRYRAVLTTWIGT